MMISDPLFTLVALPIVAGSVCLLIPGRSGAVLKAVAGAIASLSLAGSVYVLTAQPISSRFGAGTFLRADGLSAFIGMVVCVFALLITVYSFGFIERSLSGYFGYLLMTLGASLGVLYADNLILMAAFWGFLALMLYMMVNLEGTKAAAVSSRKALIIIGGTDVVMLLGIALVWKITGTLSMDGARLPLAGILAYAAYFSIVTASLAKAGAMPFHSWLPDVAEDASSAVAAYLPASLDKLLGIYLLARASFDIFITNKSSNLALMIIGAFTIVVAVMLALVQHNYKRLLGYHAVSQVGYMVLGIGSGTVVGLAGGLFHMLNNAIYKSCLFLAGGAVEKRTGTMELDRLGGLAKFMPVSFVACLVASLSISGIPPLNGFVSKWMIYQGIIEAAGTGGKLWIVWLAAAMFGSALTIASFMKLLHATFLGRHSDDIRHVSEVGPLMYIPMLTLAALCVILGVFAFRLPIPFIAAPAIPGSLQYIGTWISVPATILILVGLAAGLLIYWMAGPKGLRSVDNFIGGEDPESLPRISGTEFYDTIKDIGPIGRFYKNEASGNLDPYNMMLSAVYHLMRPLKRLHNGVLPTYMVWSLLGMIGFFAVLLFK